MNVKFAKVNVKKYTVHRDVHLQEIEEKNNQVWNYFHPHPA